MDMAHAGTMRLSLDRECGSFYERRAGHEACLLGPMLGKLALIAPLVVASVVGCGNAVPVDRNGGTDGSGTGAGTGGSGGGSCEPTCEAGRTPSKGMSCGDVGNCAAHFVCGEWYLCMGPCPVGMCKPGDIKVDTCPPGATCYVDQGCPQLAYGTMPATCAVASTCTAQPVCDPGDTVTEGACPSDASCYSPNVCGHMIECIDDALPQHRCPETLPGVGAACVFPALVCDYPTTPGCTHELNCSNVGIWADAGEVCL